MKPNVPHIPDKPPKRLVVIQGKGTAFEKRIDTGIMRYWVEALQTYCSDPDDLEE